MNHYSSAQVTAYPPYENYGGDLDLCTNTDITDDFTSDVTPNYTRNTMVSYGGTNLITTIVPGTINSSQTIYLTNYGIFGQYGLSNSSLFSTDSLKKVTTYGIHDVANLTLGLTNIGDKTVTILVPFEIPASSTIVVNTKTGTTVNGVDSYDFTANKAIHAFVDQNIKLNYQYSKLFSYAFTEVVPIRLEPGESLIRNDVHLESTSYAYLGGGTEFLTMIHTPKIGSGNYTMTAVSRFLAATDQGCTMVYLWSQPVDLTVLPDTGNNSFLSTISGSIIHLSLGRPLSDGGSVITHYKLERSTDEKNWTTILLPPSQLYYNDYGVDPGTTYYYRLSTINAVGISPPSEIMSTTVPQSKGDNSTLSTVSDTDFHLSWAAPLYTRGSVITHYNIERSTDEKNWTVISLPPSQLYYDDHGLDPGTTYHYRILAINATNGIVLTSEVISKTALWSKLVQTNVINETIPEFPFAVLILMISVVSLIVFYKMKFGAQIKN